MKNNNFSFMFFSFIIRKIKNENLTCLKGIFLSLLLICFIIKYVVLHMKKYKINYFMTYKNKLN